MTVERFGGLNLVADPGELAWSGAASAQSVEFDLNGTVRTRPGYDQTDANTMAFTSFPPWLARFRNSSQYVLVGDSLRAYNSSFVSTATAVAGGQHAVEAGNAGNANLYIAATGPNMFRWDGAAATNIGAIPDASFVALQPTEDRLVVGGITNTGANASRVSFSNPGAAETFGALDFVELHPNDGQQIRMLVSWRELLFAFKDEKFYVFYGNSVDATGGTIFNYRTVDTGVGCGYNFAACAAFDGVYFVNASGVWRTTGGPPERVSQALQPFFDERTNGIFTPTGPLTSPRIHAGKDRLYVWQKGATGMFVLDLRSREWTYWVLGTAPYALLPLDTTREFIFCNSTGQLYKFSPDYTDDDGTAIASHYQTGFTSLAKGMPTTLRRFELTGSGTVTHTLYGDHSTAAEWQGTAATSVVMGTAPVVAKAYGLQSGRCRDLAFKVSKTSGAWALSRWTGLISAVRSY